MTFPEGNPDLTIVLSWLSGPLTEANKQAENYLRRRFATQIVSDAVQLNDSKTKRNMKIAVIGASAEIGLQTTRLALEEGHEVTTLSRRIVSLPDHVKLRRVRGSATSLNDVRAAVERAEAILVTLGVKSPLATTLFSDSARICDRRREEMGSSPILIVLTGFGTGESWSYNSLPMKTCYAAISRKSMRTRVSKSG